MKRYQDAKELRSGGADQDSCGKQDVLGGSAESSNDSSLIMTAFQASPRGGLLRIMVNQGARRVIIMGEAVTSARGTLWR